LALSLKLFKHTVTTFNGAGELEAWKVRDVVEEVVGGAAYVGTEIELEIVHELRRLIVPLADHDAAKVVLTCHAFNKGLHYNYARRPQLGNAPQPYFFLFCSFLSS